MKILVTGHRGYIGSHLLTDLESLEHDVVGIDLKEGDDVLHCLPNENYDYVFLHVLCLQVMTTVCCVYLVY